MDLREGDEKVSRAGQGMKEDLLEGNTEGHTCTGRSTSTSLTAWVRFRKALVEGVILLEEVITLYRKKMS